MVHRAFRAFLYPRCTALLDQTEEGLAFGRRLLGLPRFRENPAAGQFQNMYR